MARFTTYGKNNFGVANVKVKVYDGCKYDATSQKLTEIEYKIVRWGIFNLKDFDHDEKMDIINNDMLDENDEYLKIWRKDEGDGSESATFRNSHVDMFVI